ncbi:phage protein NinX family protein [Enterobacter roggenkampii]|uniref:phage protein NinX family protein n=1 Tax=Enterobacter roggenkampii TaxID=1812935 RepID=UPI0020035B08|nr:phage protein NinX family protein [Enterobacter roggenkampii]MCK6840530.1 DUF2591 domain-containing protein [Enterobacter roggenkampii]
MDYSQLSDFEINKRVGIALGKELMPDDCQDFGLSGFPEVMLRNGDFKDYCNNPADTWPIIESNFIALHPLKHKSVWIAMSDDQEHTVRDEKPLRAAMIIFLMSKESFNA